MNITTDETTVTIGQCTATCLAASEAENGKRLYTFELRYPRIIHGEFMTHRVFSRNAMSSRATPAKVLIEDVLENPYVPQYILGNKSGMVGEDTLTEEQKMKFLSEYNRLVGYTCQKALELNALGVHKNLINRLIEPYSFMKTIVTATEWDNFFKLRLAPDAEPNMRDLADAIKQSMGVIDAEEPIEVDSTLYHLPYVSLEESKTLAPLEAMMVSAARCARVSYYNHDGSEPNIDKDIQLFHRLLRGGHFSPMEHPCVECSDSCCYYNIKGFMSLRYILNEKFNERY